MSVNISKISTLPIFSERNRSLFDDPSGIPKSKYPYCFFPFPSKYVIEDISSTLGLEKFETLWTAVRSLDCASPPPVNFFRLRKQQNVDSIYKYFQQEVEDCITKSEAKEYRQCFEALFAQAGLAAKREVLECEMP